MILNAKANSDRIITIKKKKTKQTECLYATNGNGIQTHALPTLRTTHMHAHTRLSTVFINYCIIFVYMNESNRNKNAIDFRQKQICIYDRKENRQ